MTEANGAHLLGVAGFALVVTYYTTASVPGYGIVSTFPWSPYVDMMSGYRHPSVIFIAVPFLQAARALATLP